MALDQTVHLGLGSESGISPARSSYAVKEILVTLQGEGARSGSKALFVRFAGCNLWNGLPNGRASGSGACAAWCDTDFVGGEKLGLVELLTRAEVAFPYDGGERWVVLTGGEPALQVDAALISGFHLAHWKIAIETNGTQLLPNGIDWVTVSPKRGSELHVFKAEELKVVLPGSSDGGWTDAELEALEADGRWGHLFVQPQDVLMPAGLSVFGGVGLSIIGERKRNAERCVEFVKSHPRWRLSTQTHKAIGIP
jgi:7-carboxy-7-deazaguanine synthase